MQGHYGIGRSEFANMIRFTRFDSAMETHFQRLVVLPMAVCGSLRNKKVLLAGWTDDACLQVGRTPPLSREKWATHFPRLREFTGIAYDRMLYFDDRCAALDSLPV